MIYIIVKILLTAALIVIISEIAKLNDRLGGLISALPITTLFVITWLYFENVSYQKISNHITYTLLYVLPTLPMFLCFPFLIEKYGFYIAVLLSIILTICCIVIFDFLIKKIGIKFL